LSDLLVIWDLLACAASGQIALGLYARYVIGKPLDFSTSGPFWRDMAFGSLIVALTLRDPAGLLNRRLGSVTAFVMRAGRRCLLAFAALIVVGLATRATDDLARLWLVSWLVIFASTVAGTRAACGFYLRHLHGRGGLRESIAIVGAAGVRDRVAARIAGEANVVGTFCSESFCDATVQDLFTHEADDMANLFELGREGGVDSVVLALEHGHVMDVAQIVQRLKALPVQVAVCSDDDWSTAAATQLRLLGGLPMAVVADRPIKQWDLLIKNLLDKVGALILLVLLLPLLLGIAIAVGLSSPGPIIFRQRRQGWSGRDFTVFKFRTMFAQASGPFQSFQTRRDDVRCTSVGRILRRCSLDELPQLWNVLRGEMSLVGPRPHADSLHDVDRAGREIVADYAQRNRVKPGITGWAQVHGARGATATLDQLRRRVEYDLFYIENWSLLLDIQILLRTPFSMTGENAF
jgi:putative colanic acid biosynthesis UDP-glucose lipid carrier transferase